MLFEEGLFCKVVLKWFLVTLKNLWLLIISGNVFSKEQNLGDTLVISACDYI